MQTMQSVFAESLTLSQVKDLGTQIHTIHFYIADLYQGLQHWWWLYAILIFRWGKPCFIPLMSYAQH